MLGHPIGYRRPKMPPISETVGRSEKNNRRSFALVLLWGLSDPLQKEATSLRRLSINFLRPSWRHRSFPETRTLSREVRDLAPATETASHHKHVPCLD